MFSYRRRFKKFGSDQKGSAAVEFALVGPLFLAFMFSMIELGLIMTKIALLDQAVAQSAKFIYTGAATSGNPTQDSLEDFICDRSVLFVNCKENITVEVIPVTDFTGSSAGAAQCSDSEDVDQTVKPVVDYMPGGGTQIAMLRVCITTEIFTPGLRYSLGAAVQNTKTGRAQFVSLLAFMNEPF